MSEGNQDFLRTGNVVTFGSYPQKAAFDNPPKQAIEWIVLDTEENRSLLLSRYILDMKSYHEKWEDITWEGCGLRRWLNQDFLTEAFTEQERTRIPTVTIENPDNANWVTSGGRATRDQIFLISINDLEKYFLSEEEKKRVAKEKRPFVTDKYYLSGKEQMCFPTDYAFAKNKGSRKKDIGDEKLGCWWWLRTIGDNGSRAACVGPVYAFLRGHYVDDCAIGVRPALWITWDEETAREVDA
ncbi:MAG: hypothetical protein IKE58_07455 [Blautia sp.]|nr:hypothetical protein [Blautia sp.]